MKNRIKVSEDNECTANPFWIIVDPAQNFEVGSQGVTNIASMITGVFFSRESAELCLNQRRHHFSKNAVVYCHSGYMSDEWIEALEEGKNAKM